MKGGSVDEASLSLKRPRGGGAPSLGTLEDMLEGSSEGASLCEGLHKGTWREGSLVGDPVGYVEKGSGDRHLLP